MTTIKRVGVLSVRILGSIFGAALLAYVILVVINWRDQPPSASTFKLTQLYQNRPSVPDEENAYVFMLGFSSSPDTSPMEIGRERKEWIRQALSDSSIDTDSDPLANDFDYILGRDKSVIGLSEACSKFEVTCLVALESGHDVILNWLVSEQWLLVRYKSLIAFAEYFEPMPYDVRIPLPSYTVMLEGQKLLFAKSWLLAEQGNAEHVRVILDQDLIFWRMVLKNSDSLITKMIATAAISRHFKMANLVFHNTSTKLILNSVPPSWRIPIDTDERSMQRSFVGEWIFADKMIKETTKDDLNLLSSDYDTGEHSICHYIVWKLMKPLWQPQESSNMHADMMLLLSEQFDTTYDRVDEVLAEARNFDQTHNQPFHRAYNLIGDWLLRQDHTNFAKYTVRVTDLEGLRRAAMLAVELRANGIDSNVVATQLELANIRNPYTNDPFEWDDELNAAIFNGLESNERGRHSLIY